MVAFDLGWYAFADCIEWTESMCAYDAYMHCSNVAGIILLLAEANMVEMETLRK